MESDRPAGHSRHAVPPMAALTVLARQLFAKPLAFCSNLQYELIHFQRQTGDGPGLCLAEDSKG